MPMVVHNKQRIFFRFEGDKGAFLLLHHGLLGSHGDWYDSGYVAELSKQFRLIVPDARGHGRSDHPDSATDYAADELADDIIGILDSLDIRNTHFLGLSLGSLVGFNLLRRYPERIRVTLLGGEVPFVSSAAREVWARYGETLSSGNLADLRRELMLPEAPAADAKSEAIQTAASKALLEAMSGWQDLAEERISVLSPLALFCGEQDPARERIQNAVSRIARVRLIALPGENSNEVFRAKDSLLDLLYRYIRTGRQDQDNRKSARDSDNRKRPQRGQGGGGKQGQGPSSGANGGNTRTAPQAPASEAATEAATTGLPQQAGIAQDTTEHESRDDSKSAGRPSDSRQEYSSAPMSSGPAEGAADSVPELRRASEVAEPSTPDSIVAGQSATASAPDSTGAGESASASAPDSTGAGESASASGEHQRLEGRSEATPADKKFSGSGDTGQPDDPASEIQPGLEQQSDRDRSYTDRGESQDAQHRQQDSTGEEVDAADRSAPTEPVPLKRADANSTDATPPESTGENPTGASAAESEQTPPVRSRDSGDSSSGRKSDSEE